jgi:hypothetical protein
MRPLRAVGRFAYDLIVGDDWTLAIAVLASLAVVYAAIAWTSLPDAAVAVVGAVAVLVMFAASVLGRLDRS